MGPIGASHLGVGGYVACHGSRNRRLQVDANQWNWTSAPTAPEREFFMSLAVIMVFLPLLGAAICGLVWRWIGEGLAIWTATCASLISALLAWSVFLNVSGPVDVAVLGSWLVSGSIGLDWAVRVDRVSMLCAVTITSVTALVAVYSHRGLRCEDHFDPDTVYRPRFFAALLWLCFAGLILVMSHNLAQLLAGWGGVTLGVMLMMGFRDRTTNATKAATGAAVVFALAGMMMGLAAAILFLQFDALRFDDIAVLSPGANTVALFGAAWPTTNIVAALLVAAALLSAAQFPFQSWLLAGVDTPSPAMALVQSTILPMASLFVLLRFFPVLEFAPNVMVWLMVFGIATALFGGLCALVQTDIRQALACIGVAQLGLIFAAVGLGAPTVALWQAVIFAAHQSVLILGAGSVVRAMGGASDLGAFGGLRAKMPVTFWAMVAGALSTAGIGLPGLTVGFAGFAPRTALAEVAASAGPPWVLAALGVGSLVLACAVTRVVILCFMGPARGPKEAHKSATESAGAMLAPLGVLAVVCVIGGVFWQGSFYHQPQQVSVWFGQTEVALAPKEAVAKDKDNLPTPVPAQQAGLVWTKGGAVLQNARAVPATASLAVWGAGLLGLLLAFGWVPRMDLGRRSSTSPVRRYFSQAGGLDRVWDRLVGIPAQWFGRTLGRWGDDWVFDGVAQAMAGLLAKAFQGRPGAHFTFVMAVVLGIMGLVIWITGMGVS